MCELMLLCGLVIGQAEAPSADLKRSVIRLVDQMDSNLAAERDAAEKKILDLGTDVLSVLPDPNPRFSSEVNNRLRRIRLVLERRRAEATVEPSRVTLTAEKLPLSEVLAAIEKQTGNAVLDYRERLGQQTSDPELTLKFDKTPFWTALDEVLEAAEMTIYPYPDEAGVAIVNRGTDETSDQAPRQVVGPFRLAANEIVARRQFREGGHSCQLALEVSWEPRLQPIVLTQDTGKLEIEADTGPLELDAVDSEIQVTVGAGEMIKEMRLPITPPERKSQSIKRLKGKLNVVVPGQVETFLFGNLRADKIPEQRKGGVTVYLDRVRKVNAAAWEVRVRVKFDETAGAFQSHLNWMLDNVAGLQSPDEELRNWDTSETTLRTDNEFGIAYLFVVEDIAKYKLVYKTPVLILEVPIEYEIKDIPLP